MNAPKNRVKTKQITHGRRKVGRGDLIVETHVTVGSSNVADESIMSISAGCSGHFTVYLSVDDLRWLAQRCIEDADAIEKDIADMAVEAADEAITEPITKEQKADLFQAGVATHEWPETKAGAAMLITQVYGRQAKDGDA